MYIPAVIESLIEGKTPYELGEKIFDLMGKVSEWQYKYNTYTINHNYTVGGVTDYHGALEAMSDGYYVNYIGFYNEYNKSVIQPDKITRFCMKRGVTFALDSDTMEFVKDSKGYPKQNTMYFDKHMRYYVTDIKQDVNSWVDYDKEA